MMKHKKKPSKEEIIKLSPEYRSALAKQEEALKKFGVDDPRTFEAFLKAYRILKPTLTT